MRTWLTTPKGNFIGPLWFKKQGKKKEARLHIAVTPDTQAQILIRIAYDKTRDSLRLELLDQVTGEWMKNLDIFSDVSKRPVEEIDL